MRKHSRIFAFGIGLAILSTSNFCSGATTGSDIEKFLSRNGWTADERQPPMTDRSADLVPLIYYPKGINVPACGLLDVSADKPSFLEILSPEPGETYPHCVGINDAARFSMAGKKYVVFEYSDRDSRDETYDRFFYVYKNKNSYVADEKLNAAFDGALRSKSKAPLKAIDGIKLARTYQLKLAQPKLTMLSHDLVIDGTGGFAVFKEKSSVICTFVLDNGVQLTSYTSELFNRGGSCVDFVASSKLEMPTKTFYLAMYNGTDKKRQLAIFSVAKNTAIVSA